MADVSAEVLEVIANQAKVAPQTVLRDSELEDLGLESLDAVELIFALEERFGIEIPYNANDTSSTGLNFTTAGDVIDAVQGLVDKRDGP